MSSEEGLLKLARLPRLDTNAKAKCARSVVTANMRAWLHSHAMIGKVDKLHPAVESVIEKWFELVDDDGSRTLSHSELFSALKAARVPCDDATIKTLIGLMDINKDGVIGWEEFQMFMTEEFVAGKSLLGGEYLLPTGVALPFGAMVDKLSRDRLMQEVMTPGASRNRWADVARDPAALSHAVSGIRMAAQVTQAAAPRGASSSQQADDGGGGGTAEPLTPRQALTTAMLQELEAEKAAAAAAAAVAAAAGGGVTSPVPPGGSEQLRCRISTSKSMSRHVRSVSPGPDSPCGDGPAGAVCPSPGSGAATARSRAGLSPLPAGAAAGASSARSPYPPPDSPHASGAAGHASRLASQMAALFGGGGGDGGSPGGGSVASRSSSFQRRRSTGPFNVDFGAVAAAAAAGDDSRSPGGWRSPGGASPGGGAHAALPPMPYCYTAAVHSAGQTSALPSSVITDELVPFAAGPGDCYTEPDGMGRPDGTAAGLEHLRARSCSNLLLLSQRSQQLLQRQQMQAQLPIVPPPLAGPPGGGSSCSGLASSPFQSGGASGLGSPATEARRLPPLQLPLPPPLPHSASAQHPGEWDGGGWEGDAYLNAGSPTAASNGGSSSNGLRQQPEPPPVLGPTPVGSRTGRRRSVEWLSPLGRQNSDLSSPVSPSLSSRGWGASQPPLSRRPSEIPSPLGRPSNRPEQPLSPLDAPAPGPSGGGTGAGGRTIGPPPASRGPTEVGILGPPSPLPPPAPAPAGGAGGSFSGAYPQPPHSTLTSPTAASAQRRRAPQRTLSLVGHMAERLAEERRAALLQEAAAGPAGSASGGYGGFSTARSLASPGGAGHTPSSAAAAAAAAGGGAGGGRDALTDRQLLFGASEDGEGAGSVWGGSSSGAGAGGGGMRAISSTGGSGWPAAGGLFGAAATGAGAAAGAGAGARPSIPPLQLGSDERDGPWAQQGASPTSRPTYSGTARAMPVLTNAAGMNGYLQERLAATVAAAAAAAITAAVAPHAAEAGAGVAGAGAVGAEAGAAAAPTAAPAAPGSALLSPQPPAPRPEAPRPPLGGEASRLRLTASALSAAATAKAPSAAAGAGAGGR
ncbi:hypothetical protein HXX76_007474 [Chlamydomonas incerta]|uniref:EF-hand domain-containing protein n=1 Tax=Chlamydomonas incerta TaxID=51695 RepID=A0A835VZV3_CHLIN|nr:hypothetical protein HXX76_007474 [Chlamydomonas incerta]|eukprot:KAG2435402.1 hypothetical protein HXX76_007474 [Chlamydomonas incerta]